MRLRDCDAAVVARQNAAQLERERIARNNSAEARAQRAAHNQRLAQQAIATWSADKIALCCDAEFNDALEGRHFGDFNPFAAKYMTEPTRTEHYTVTESREAQRRRDARTACDPMREMSRAVVNSERKI